MRQLCIAMQSTVLRVQCTVQGFALQFVFYFNLVLHKARRQLNGLKYNVRYLSMCVRVRVTDRQNETYKQQFI